MTRVVVVGAGVVGLAAAWELRLRGHEVTVVDASPGNGASHAAAGMLAPAAEMVWGEDALAPMMAAAADRHPAFLASVRAASGRPTGHRTEGTLVVGAEPADVATLTELLPLQRAQGHTAQRLTGSSARRLEPALGPRVAGAVEHPGDHQVDPRLLVRALLAAVQAPATQVADPAGTPARFVPQHAAGVSRAPATGAVTGVLLADGTRLEADEVLLATAAWRVPGTEDLGVRPVRGDVIRVRQRPGTPPLLTRVVRALVAGRPVYLVPRTDGQIVIGASTREDDADAPSTEGVWQLLDDARRLVPGIVDTTIDDIVSRSRPGTHDGLPIIRRLDPGLSVCTGTSRHGILLSPLTAALAADVVEGVDTGAAPIRLPADQEVTP